MSLFSRKPAYVPVYDRLIALGYTDEQIRNKAEAYNSTRTFTVVTSDTPDGTPIVGLSYAGDFRSEEENGMGDLMKALTGGTHREYSMQKGVDSHVAYFTDVNAIALSTRKLATTAPAWGDEIFADRDDRYPVSGTHIAERTGKADYADHYASSLAWAQESKGQRLQWKKMTELREMAKSMGIKPGTIKKDALVDLISSHPNLPRERPNTWPGYFHYGTLLVLRANDGLAADVLRLLIEAAREGKLALGGGRQVFGSGLGLYDVRDEGPQLKAERKAAADFYDAGMKALEPVEKELRARGHYFYFLGKPTILNPGNSKSESSLHFWLNGSGNPQPGGWYTLEELLAEKFVDDARTKHAERLAKR